LPSKIIVIDQHVLNNIVAVTAVFCKDCSLNSKTRPTTLQLPTADSNKILYFDQEQFFGGQFEVFQRRYCGTQRFGD
jgi:hypothetical protein